MRLRDLAAVSMGNLKRLRLRTALTTAGVVIAIGTFVAMVSFGAGNQKYITEQFDKLGLLYTMQVYPANKPAAADTMKPRQLDDAALAELSRIPGVRLAYPYDAIGVTAALADSQVSSTAQALPAAAMRTKLFSQWDAGAPFAGDSVKHAIVAPSLLKTFGIGKPDSALGRRLVLSVRVATIDSGLASLVPHDPEYIRRKIRSLSPDSLLKRRYRQRYARALVDEGISRFLDGFFNRRATISDTLRIVGVLSEGGTGPARLAPIIVPLATAARFRSSGLSENPADLFSALSSGNVFSLESAASSRSYPRVTLDLDPAVPLQAVSDSVETLGFRTFSFAEQFKELQRFFFYSKLVLGVIGLIALATASLGIINTMVMSILERRREIGVLKSLGANENDIRFLFLVESGIIGGLGSVFGIVLGWLATRVASLVARAIMERQGVGSIELFAMPLWLVAIAFAIGLAVSLAAGYYPASRAASVDPVEALRNE